jgi:CheY-like chemotaxis protein
MPQMNGIILAQTVRADPRFSHIPIFLTSAGVRDPGGLADEYIPKPFNIQRVESLINRYLARLIQRLP